MTGSSGGPAVDPSRSLQPAIPEIDAERAARRFEALVRSVRSVVYAPETTLRLAVACFAAQGHLLIEDLPGLGKTTMAKALARSFGLEFRRIQCTSDLLPSDVTGAMVYDTAEGEPVFRRGPIFTNVLMADELNRAPARTQSALLESMEEHQVSVDGYAARLPSPFLVVATQNPHDTAGTAPLPHVQLDRFLARLSLGYPDRVAEDALLAGGDPAEVVATMPPPLSDGDVDHLLSAVACAHVAPAARTYVLDLVTATREHPSVAVGASPRAARALLRMSRALAVADARPYVVPEDVRSATTAVLAHRLVLDPRSMLTGATPEAVLDDLLERTPVPLGDASD